MANRKGGLNGFTVQESNNVGLGQGGSIFIDTTGTDYLATTYDANSVFVAITVVSSAAFNDLIAPQSDKYIGTTGAMGSAIDTSNTFSAGLTIFGRWSKIDLSAGAVIAYLGC
tara:strand:- start:1517 stop:1855 length:339 start_codon:yes stop_codon:yes gene_type:complete